MRWYVVQVHAGFEKKVTEQIKEQAAQKGMVNHFDEILVPSQPVTETRRGQKIVTDQKFFPGYVLIRTDMSDQIWHLLRNTPKVTGILGSKGKPTPISDAEAERVKQQTQDGIQQPPRQGTQFEIGEQVRVAEGPFASFNGTVQDVDDVNGRMTISVSIFGRATPVELEYGQVQKI